MSSIFVFGSNRQGIHRRGAAKYALENHGAIIGQGIGMQGTSYALPTKETPWVSLPLDAIQVHVNDFMDFAREHPEMDFLVTRVGCGLAGYTDTDIGPMFKGAPSNCQLPDGWGQ